MSTSITSGSDRAPRGTLPGVHARRRPPARRRARTTCSTAVLRELLAQQLEALRRGDEHAHAAVVEDVGDLPGLQHRVDRHEDAAGGRGAEDRHDGLDPLVEVDADALAALEPERLQARREGRDLVPQLGVGQGRVLERERRRVGRRRAESATIWWSCVRIVSVSLSLGPTVSPGHADQLAVQVVDLARLRGSRCGTSSGAGSRTASDSRGGCSTTARSTSVAAAPWRSSRCRASGPAMRAEELGVAHVQDRGEQRAAPCAGPCGR